MESLIMQIDKLKDIARKSGVVGAGGAGFPSYAKMTDKADTVILNCAECEPLLKLHRQLLALYTEEIVQMLDEVREAMGAKEAVVGIKAEYVSTVNALKQAVKDFKNVRICEMTAAYPAGDEVVLIYEATGRVIKPGGLPIDENVVVYNVETMYNLYNAVHAGKPVTEKLVSIVGEVERPVTVRVPLGATLKEVLKSAGRITVKNPAYVIGGPMMGFMGSANTIVTKTTNAVIVLPENHSLVARMNRNAQLERRRASSSCCQCRTCTDLCPRHNLGHPIEPHRIMRAVANSDISDLSVYTNSAYCSGCGLCEKFSCPQGLSPKTVIGQFKGALRAAGIRPQKLDAAAVSDNRDLKKVPSHRLAARLGLAAYDVDAPLEDELLDIKRVKIPVSMHIGAPAIAAVKTGDSVKTGDVIANAADGLSVSIHSSIDGRVESVTDKEIVIIKG